MIRCVLMWGGGLLRYKGSILWVTAPSRDALAAVLAPWPKLGSKMLWDSTVAGKLDDFVLPAGTMALVAYLIDALGEPS